MHSLMLRYTGWLFSVKFLEKGMVNYVYGFSLSNTVFRDVFHGLLSFLVVCRCFEFYTTLAVRSLVSSNENIVTYDPCIHIECRDLRMSCNHLTTSLVFISSTIACRDPFDSATILKIKLAISLLARNSLVLSFSILSLVSKDKDLGPPQK